MSEPHYNIEWLLQKFDNGEPVDYLFFWGHTHKGSERVGKACFSQWFASPFTVDDITYKTAEHWMMAQKALLFEDTKAFEKIVGTEKPGDVKSLGRTVLNFNEERWNEHRFNIVKTGNVHKFNQQPELANFLLGTGDKIIVEASPVDVVWGIGLAQDSRNIENPYHWRGLNLLGFALMEVRDFFGAFGHFDDIKPPVELPWQRYPAIHPMDIFWRMGSGEDFIAHFNKHYAALSEREKTVLALTKPAPPAWQGFYDE